MLRIPLIAMFTTAISCFIIIVNSDLGTSEVAYQPGTYSFPDRSNPQALLKTFIETADALADGMQALEKHRLDSGSWFYPQLDKTTVADVNRLRLQMVHSLDLTEIPDWEREKAGIEVGLMIREIMHATKVDASTPLRELNDGTSVIHGSYLRIETLQTGVNVGDYVFNAQTVAVVRQLYDSIKNSREGEGKFDAYQYYSNTPGDLLPPPWAGLVLKLPSFWSKTYGDNTVWQWTIFGFTLASVIFLPSQLAQAFGRAMTSRLVWQFSTMSLLAGFGGDAIVNQVNITGPAETLAHIVFDIFFYGSAAGLVFMATERITKRVAEALKLNTNLSHNNILRLFSRVMGSTAAASLLIYGANDAGAPVMGIIAGLGVGGLAFALAAQPTLQNLMAGIVLFLDKRVGVGDKIEVRDISGVIEEIGIRSTVVRSPDGALISITNSHLADQIIKNLSGRR